MPNLFDRFNPFKRVRSAPPPQPPELDRLIENSNERWYQSAERADTISACDEALAVWERLKQLHTPAQRSVEVFQQEHQLKQNVADWLINLTMYLHNAGLDQPRYHTERIRVSREIVQLFPAMPAVFLGYFGRAEAEALWDLGRKADAEAVFQRLIEQYPDYAWGYIGWADRCFIFGRVEEHRDKYPLDYERAEALLKQALARPDLDDRIETLDRLIDLYYDMDRPEVAAPFEAELERLAAEQEAR